MVDNKNPHLRILMLIATAKLVDKAADMFKKAELPIQYRLNAKGTASNEILDVLGIGRIDKCVLVSAMPKSFADKMLDKLHTELKLDTLNSGIAFTIPLTGTNNLLLRMVTQSLGETDSQSERKEENNMIKTNHALIAAVVNRGFSNNVMEAAKEGGASGGTVMHSRRISSDEVTSFWGLSVQEEKEIVLILAEIDKKLDIMRKIGETCGIQSDAKGIVMSLPIDSVIGF